MKFFNITTTHSFSVEGSAIGGLRRQHRFLRSIAAFTLLAFTSLTMQPLAAAINAPDRAKPLRDYLNREKGVHEQVGESLDRITTTLETMLIKRKQKRSDLTERKQLKQLRQQLQSHDTQVMADFDSVAQHIKAKKLPAVILERQQRAVARYKDELNALNTELDALETETDQTKKQQRLEKALQRLDRHRKHNKTEFDPNDMPHGTTKPVKDPKPRLDKKSYRTASLFDSQLHRQAAHGTYIFDGLPGASDPAYLAASDEVLLTQPIIDQAAALNHHPVQIYNWVYNNIQWLPTWGASQDAEVTLGSRRGNAQDIASLMIALYRASGIPARYVHGAITLSPERFMNLTGNFTDIHAALEFAAFGSVPVTQNIAGGKVASVTLEHIWVEAAIDFAPSRGAVNKSADAWVSLDPSIKPYEYLQGLDVLAISGIDPNQLATDFSSSGTINEAEGWVQNLDATILQTAQTNAQTALTNHINTMTNPTVGDVIGGRKITPRSSEVLPTSLPYQTVITGNRYGQLPDGLRNFMTYAFGRDTLGELVNPITLPLSKLNNHKITYSFKPATANDEAVLVSYLPEGEITDPSQLPSSLPAYLVYVIPEIAVDGVVVAQAPTVGLGEEQTLVFQTQIIAQPNNPKTYKVPAGSYLSLAAARNSISASKLQDLQAKLTETKAKLESGDQALISTISREEYFGDIFYACVLGYFSQYLSIGYLKSLADTSAHGLSSGFGSIGYEPKVTTFFGFPRNVGTGGLAVNMWVGGQFANLQGDIDNRKQFVFEMGNVSSALEHMVPELMLNSDPNNSVEGVSAIKALELAAQQGQKIFQITPANAETVLPQLNIGALAIQEITQGLNAGKNVIVHENQISVPGFTGEGYIIYSPVDGNGAWKISGGGNGAFTFWLTVAFFILMFLINLFSRNGFGMGMVLIGYNAFLNKVKWIAQQEFSPEKAADELEKAAMTSVIASLGSFGIGKMKLGYKGLFSRTLQLLTMLINWAFFSVWQPK